MTIASESTTVHDDDLLAHSWVVAATIPVTEKIAKHAVLRLSFRAIEGQKVDALEVYCGSCRRPYDDVADEPCSAPVNNEHLRGGPIGERKKRKFPAGYDPDNPDFIPGPQITRQGIEAYIGGGAADR